MSTFNKISFATIEKVESRIARWILEKKYRIAFLALTMFLIRLVFFLPYINLFFNSYLITLVGVVLTPFILDIQSRPFFVVGVLSFGLAALFWLVGQKEEAEILTDYIFIVLLSGVLRASFSS